MNSNHNQLTVGVLGGMGPYATLAFLHRILANTPAQRECDHLRVVIDSNPKIPSRTRAFLFGEADPVPMMIDSAAALKRAGAHFLAVPCNSAHYFLPRVCDSVDIPYLNMVDHTCEEIVAYKAKVVGLLAGEVTVKSRLYESRLAARQVFVLPVSDHEQAIARSVIEDVKNNRVSPDTQNRMQSLITGMEGRGADSIILGCTEFPIIAGQIRTSCRIIDTVEVLAKAVVAEATRSQSMAS